MTKRKRKAPERKAARRQPGLFYRGVHACGGLVARHPSVAGGCAAFAVIFTFISANALWYQPGSHPSPLFRTRVEGHPNALAAYRRQEESDAGRVTTFRIERSQDEADDGGSDAATGSPAAPSQLVMDVQQELSRRGLYTGAADGMMGPRTSAAILAFEAKIGMEETGEASGELLAALQSETTASTVLPKERPVEDVPSVGAIDPVAAAIRAAETGTPARAALGRLSAANTELVMQIQKGLSNIAYANVSIDGVAGTQTRAAIRHFEKHYRLPETGEPNERVLKKLQQIGAL